MIASPPASTGAGRPAMWVSSPIPVAICHRDRSGGAGETDTTPACCGPPWYWVHPSAGCAEAAAAEAIPAIMMAAGIDRMIGRERKVRHPTGATLCAGPPAAVSSAEGGESDERGQRDGAEVGERIDVRAVELHAEMQMRDGRTGMTPSGRRDRLALEDTITLLDQLLGKPRVRGGETSAVVDREEEVPTDGTRERDRSR